MIKSKPKRNFDTSVNPSSMADIGFLLLIFFLVSTTINIDEGILVKLPPYEEDVNPPVVKNKNICRILVNKENQLLVRNELMEVDQLSNYLKNFIKNPLSDSRFASDPTKAIVSIQNDRSTSYHSYIEVYNEIKRAYNELRDEVAFDLYQVPFSACNKIQQKQIARQIPMIISEAEPVDHS